MTNTDEETIVPGFAHAVRGYDRLQVDEYIVRLNEWAGGAQARALEAEEEAAGRARELADLRQKVTVLEKERPGTPDVALKAAADKASETVKDAVEQAGEIRRAAVDDADRRVDDANRQALGVVEAARQAVHRLNEEVSEERQEASSRIDRMIEGAEEKAARLVSDAQGHSDQIRAKADEHVRAVAAELERLKAERAEIMNELGRLRSSIHGLISADANQNG